MEMRLKQGFTMMELMIVVVIIGVLLAFIGPRIIDMLKSKDETNNILVFQRIRELVVKAKVDATLGATDTGAKFVAAAEAEGLKFVDKTNAGDIKTAVDKMTPQSIIDAKTKTDIKKIVWP
jgi:prepilin-type N-terminal cleavage/methylation domain-containing protein